MNKKFIIITLVTTFITSCASTLTYANTNNYRSMDISNELDTLNQSTNFNTIENIDNLTFHKTLSENGDIEIITSQNEKIYFNNLTGDLFINGQNIATHTPISDSEHRYSWIKMIDTTYTLPIGMSISAAVSAISIVTGLPLSKIKQALIAAGCISLSALDSVVATHKIQYRSSSMITPPGYTRPVHVYRNKTRTYLTKNNYTICRNDYEFFADKPWSLEHEN